MTSGNLICRRPANPLTPDSSAPAGTSSEPASKDRSALFAEAEHVLTDKTELTAFEQNMDNFYQRARDQHIAAKEVAQVNEAMSRLLTAQKFAVDAKARVLAVRSLAANLDKPAGIHQGQHGTCGSASLEWVYFQVAPGLATDMVVSTVLTGGWSGADGKRAIVAARNLAPGHEEVRFPPDSIDRSYASQLMQIVLQSEIGAHFDHPYHMEDRGGAHPEFWVDDEGHALSQDPPSKGFRNPIVDPTGGLTAWEIGGQMHRLIGMKNGILNSSKFPYNDIPSGDLVAGSSDGDVAYFTTEEDLLKVLKEKAHLPLTANVFSDAVNYGFRSPSPDARPDHFIAVQYEPGENGNPDVVLMFNPQYGSIKEITVQQLFKYMN